MSSNNSSAVNTSLPPPSFPRLPNDEIETVASTVVYVVLGLLIITGNSLVIAAYRYNSRLRTVTNTFLVGLAVSDLLVGLISVPLWIYFSICQHYQTCANSRSLLVFYSTADVFCGCASVLQLMAISVERFIAITRPIRHRNYSPAFYNGMIVAAWLYAFLMAGLYPLQVNRWQKVYTAILVTTCFALPTVVIFVVYMIIFKTARLASMKRVYPEGFPRRALQQEAKIAVTIAVVTGLFVLAWTPFFVVNVVATFCFPALPPYPGLLRLIRFIKWMHYSNSIVNPCVYAYRNIDMRRTFFRLLRATFVCCESDYPAPLNSRGQARAQNIDHHSNPPRGDHGNNTDGFAVDPGLSGFVKQDYVCARNTTTNVILSSPTLKEKDPRGPPEGGPLEKEPQTENRLDNGPGTQFVGPGEMGSITDQGTQQPPNNGARLREFKLKGIVSICEDGDDEVFVSDGAQRNHTESTSDVCHLQKQCWVDETTFRTEGN